MLLLGTMGIRFYCPNGHKLNVKAFLAGKRGICPDCAAKFIIPFENGGQVEAADEDEILLAPLDDEILAVPPLELADDVWHARTGSGAQHGPATTALIKSWIAEGKVDRDSWVWRAGWLDWQRASDVFPELGAVLEAAPLSRPKSFVEESPSTQNRDEAFQNADAINIHRRRQRQRREQIKKMTPFLAGMVFIFLLVLLFVLLK
jgi:hypothetical protein